jgi:hypothetical protein
LDAAYHFEHTPRNDPRFIQNRRFLTEKRRFQPTAAPFVASGRRALQISQWKPGWSVAEPDGMAKQKAEQRAPRLFEASTR